MCRLVTVLIFVNFLLYGCSVNPVTGKRELMIVSSAQEIAMGKQSYAPMQQSQGGSYDVDPALTRYVSGVGSRVAAKSGVSLPYEFVVLNNSVPNAWALPGGKIAINRGLLTELQSEAELAAVLGHEAVHAAARHTAQQISRSQIMQVGVAATAIVTSDSNYGNLVAGGANLAAQLSLSRYGRSAELESDRYGMQYLSQAGYDPVGAVQLQETFVRLSENRRSDWLSGLFASHPPSRERVEANRATAATLPSGGKLGRSEFQAAMRKTMGYVPAYEAYDAGRKALAEENIGAALTHANKALDLFSGEAHFHALRGDIRLAADKFDMAITNYNRAITRREGFFYYHLQRGIANKKLGRSDRAFTDLRRSLDLLPTAPAHFALGEIAEQRGNLDDAINHFKIVIKTGCDADGSGNLVVAVRNDMAAALTGVQVVVNIAGTAGQAEQRRFGVGGQIPPGKIASVNTNLGPYTRGSGCPAEVVSARIAE